MFSWKFQVTKLWNSSGMTYCVYFVIGYLHSLSIRPLFFSCGLFSPIFLLQFPSALGNQSLQVFAVLAVEGCYLCSYLSQESSRMVTLFLCSLSSSSVIVVRGAGTSTSSPSPEEQTKRASGKSAHAAPYELHEARSLTRVSVRTSRISVYVCWVCQ